MKLLPLVLGAFFGVSFLVPLPALAQSGEVVKVTQPAIIVRDGQRAKLELGDAVNVGETIVTGGSAEAQIVFSDQTRIVVGPNSQLRVDTLLFNSNTSAKRFAVTAAKGTFRFLSGKSPSKAYSVRTPIATMGVRGTAFDFAIPAKDYTDLVVHDGEVRFCRQGVSACARVPSGCQTVRMQKRLLTQPSTNADRQKILGEAFPYAIDQTSLRDDFHTAIESCKGRDATALRQINLPSIASRQLQRDDQKPRAAKGSPEEPREEDEEREEPGEREDGLPE
ncbi:FecR domain-containing protein [Defluviimonas sp. WL0050]|uniref:FecR domain-containing protein n=1 Tax=Albidovulum litorale TaxID=2984134 RepID=A0ABT2ZHT5_9RHOB|nr:FecR domain-containing protein [Defluviimonas sp. WL0050]MCV2870681.1 FecR domain-containing protein [Defluviimonas sp. WL0050]